MYIYNIFFTLMRNHMTYNHLKLSKYFLVIFLVFSQLVGCGPNRRIPEGDNSGSNRTDTSGGGSSGRDNNPGTANPKPNPGAANPNPNPPAANPNPPVANPNPPAANPNLPPANPNPNPGAANPNPPAAKPNIPAVNPGAGGQAITKQRIQELLQEVKNDGISAAPIQSNVKVFLEKLERNEVIGETFSKIYLCDAIAYKDDEIVELAVANLQDDINTPHKGITFLQFAIDCKNKSAENLLKLKGAK
jgi:hypothetical protein